MEFDKELSNRILATALFAFLPDNHAIAVKVNNDGPMYFVHNLQDGYVSGWGCLVGLSFKPRKPISNVPPHHHPGP